MSCSARESTLDCALFFRHHRLVLHLPHSLEAAYAEALPSPLVCLSSVTRQPTVMRVWEQAVTRGLVHTGGLRFAFLLRSAPLMHEEAAAVFHCPVCGACCAGRGTHLRLACPLVAGAVLRGFRQAALLLIRRGWLVVWESPTAFTGRRGVRGSTTTFCLVADDEVSGALPVAPDLVLLTWSGLLVERGTATMKTTFRVSLTAGYLNAVALWLASDPVWRWETLADPTDPAVDPTGCISAPTILALILAHTSQIPGTRLISPGRPPLRLLRGNSPAVDPLITVYVEAVWGPCLPRGHRHVSVWQVPPLILPDGHRQLLPAPGVCVLYLEGLLPSSVGRSLDVLFPPPVWAVLPQLWVTEDGSLDDPVGSSEGDSLEGSSVDVSSSSSSSGSSSSPSDSWCERDWPELGDGDASE